MARKKTSTKENRLDKELDTVFDSQFMTIVPESPPAVSPGKAVRKPRSTKQSPAAVPEQPFDAAEQPTTGAKRKPRTPKQPPMGGVAKESSEADAHLPEFAVPLTEIDEHLHLDDKNWSNQRPLRKAKVTKVRRRLGVGHGYVLSVTDGIVTAMGLADVCAGELVRFARTHVIGLVINLAKNSVGIVLLGSDRAVSVGVAILQTRLVASIPVSNGLLGTVVNALGTPIDGSAVREGCISSAIELVAPGIIARSSVNEPLHTGIKCIDSLIPIGHGQRELIIGDRQTGKTTMAIDAILAQHQTISGDSLETRCVYVAVGQKRSSVGHIVRLLRQHDALGYTVIVAATASDPAPLQFMAPFSGCTIGEYFMNWGQKALIVYDDLTKQAVAYRQVSLLLRRAPGREAYPSDIFFLHSRLLERAAKLSIARGSGSLTALPIIETQAGDVSAYIPTNVISITDGQLFLETELFYQGIRPALSVGLSVSRVGSAAQHSAFKKIVGSLKLQLVQYRQAVLFAKFGSDIDSETLYAIERGSRLVELLKQAPHSPLSFAEEVVVLFGGVRGFLNSIPLDLITLFEKRVLDVLSVETFISGTLVATKSIDAQLLSKVELFYDSVIANFRTTYRFGR